jgi:prepilin-type processing-associated H-X9-DG protein
VAAPNRAYHYGALLKRFNAGQLLIIEVEDRTDGITYQRSDALMISQDAPKTWSYGGGLFSFRHGGKMNALFMDNSVQRLEPKDWPNRDKYWKMPEGLY